METLHLSCAADRAYVPHTAAMIHSVLACSGRLQVHVHYLHGPHLPADLRRRTAGMVERLGGSIDFYEVVDERVEGLGTYSEITRDMWYRIYLPELLPGVDRVLYLDADTLAVDDLGSLWATELGDDLVAAVTNVFMPDPQHRARPAAVGLSGLELYFNSGVLLLNLAAMRRSGTTDEVREYALSHDLFFPDQDALNAVMARRRTPLHPRWNCMNTVMGYEGAREVFGAEAVEEARRRPGIRHFEGPGPNKPWHRDCPHPMRELYFEHRQATPWPRVRMVGGRGGRAGAALRRLRRRVSA